MARHSRLNCATTRNRQRHQKQKSKMRFWQAKQLPVRGLFVKTDWPSYDPHQNLHLLPPSPYRFAVRLFGNIKRRLRAKVQELRRFVQQKARTKRIKIKVDKDQLAWHPGSKRPDRLPTTGHCRQATRRVQTRSQRPYRHVHFVEQQHVLAGKPAYVRETGNQDIKSRGV